MPHRTVVAALVAVGVACGQGRERETGVAGGQPPPPSAQVTDSVGLPPSGMPGTPALTPTPEPAEDAMTMSTPGDTTVQGVVRAVGAVPTTQIVIQSGTGTAATGVGVVGPLRAELGHLVGAEVQVWGPPVSNQPPPPARAVEVARYEIVSVSGRNPYVGILERRGDEMWLNSEKIVKLAIVPPELAAANGAKVWIVGSMMGGELAVESYGVIKAR